MNRKTFVIDTNVFIHDPEAIFRFHGNDVVVPVTVLEELDKLKRVPADVGANARKAVRALDRCRQMDEGDLHSGVKIGNDIILRIVLEMKTDYDNGLALSINDNKILMSAYLLKEHGENVVFVSKDLAARVKAEAIGIEAEDYENLKYAYESLIKGVHKQEMEKPQIEAFYKDGHLKIESEGIRPNEFVIMNSAENSQAVGRWNHKTDRLEALADTSNIWGIKPRNVEQRCALDLLLRDDIKLVTLVGPAGTGKTLLALACALKKVFDDDAYRRILISRPIMPLGRDIGYLPGTKEEKLFHWMQPIYDNLQYLCETSGVEGGPGIEDSETLRWVMDSKKIEMEAVTYIRGRTLPKMFMIIDEAQNLSPHEVKTVISRAGDGTKVVLTGDPSQIDNPYLDQDSNALSYTVGKFANSKLFGHMLLEKTERSELAALAAELL